MRCCAGEFYLEWEEFLRFRDEEFLLAENFLFFYEYGTYISLSLAIFGEFHAGITISFSISGLFLPFFIKISFKFTWFRPLSYDFSPL